MSLPCRTRAKKTGGAIFWILQAAHHLKVDFEHIATRRNEAILHQVDARQACYEISPAFFHSPGLPVQESLPLLVLDKNLDQMQL